MSAWSRSSAVAMRARHRPLAPLAWVLGATATLLLVDVATVWPTGEDAVWNETLIERLAGYRADVYAGWKPAQLTAALALHKVVVGQIGRRNDAGKTVNRRGPTHDDILSAIAERNDKKASD